MPHHEVKTAIIGIGRWGKNVARDLERASELVAFASSGSPENCAWAQEHIPTAIQRTVEEICADPAIHAVAVATPIKTHASIARMCIENGKHVLVEKPLAATVQEALVLVEQAQERGVVLMTGYVLLHDLAYQELKRSFPLSSIQSVEAIWKKHGSFGESIEHNLLTHHLAFALDLLGEPAAGTLTRFRAVYSDCDEIRTELTFSDDRSFTSHIDRASEDRQHTLRITLKDGTAYDWNAPVLTETETPLQREINYFLTCASTGRLSEQDLGLPTLRLLERLAVNADQ